MIGRLKQLIKSFALTERAFALKCGIAQNTMSYYLSGKRKPSYEAIEKILLTFPEVSAEWLTRGNGDMFLGENQIDTKSAERMNKLIDSITTLQEVIDAKNSTIAALTERLKQCENQNNVK
jgi:transcriptional regulator with XRE-family HTH domain